MQENTEQDLPVIETNKVKTYLSKIESDGAEGLAVIFPQALLDALAWKVGDYLVWAQLDTDGFVVSKFKPEDELKKD